MPQPRLFTLLSLATASLLRLPASSHLDAFTRPAGGPSIEAATAMVRHAEELSSATRNNYEGTHFHNSPQCSLDSRGSPDVATKAAMRDKFPAGLAPPGPREATLAPSTAGEFELRLYAWLEECAMEQPEQDRWRDYICEATGSVHAAGVPAALQHHHAAFARYRATPYRC